MKKQFKYYTFISYKHEQKANGKFTTDEKWAHIFKSHLESWEIPAHIPSQERLNEEDERIYPVFRDSENYPVSGELNQLTHKSLSESKTLLVILSREMLEDQLRTISQLLKSVLNFAPNTTEPHIRIWKYCFHP